MMSGFERIQQKGQMDLYCNGSRHVRLSGPQFGQHPVSTSNPPALIQLMACNCARQTFEPEPVPA